MAVWALGINHHTAPLDMRGRFAFALDQIVPTLQGLRESLTGPGRQHSAVETAILSTCNRTEIYCAAEMPAMDHTLHWLANSGGMVHGSLSFYTKTLVLEKRPPRGTGSGWSSAIGETLPDGFGLYQKSMPR